MMNRSVRFIERGSFLKAHARSFEQAHREEIESDRARHADAQRRPERDPSPQQPWHCKKHRERRQDEPERAEHMSTDERRVVRLGVEPDEREERDERQRMNDARRGVVALRQLADSSDDNARQERFNDKKEHG